MMSSELASDNPSNSVLTKALSPMRWLKIVLFTGAIFLGATSARAATVTNTNDSGPGSLRQAIIDTNNSPTDNTIVFQAGLYGTIDLNNDLPTITDHVTITGPGFGDIRINGDYYYKIFTIDGPGTLNVEISGLELYRGYDGSGNGGGAIQNTDENVTIVNCDITQSRGEFVGAVSNESGTMLIVDSFFYRNDARYDPPGDIGKGGGAIYNDSGDITIRDTEFRRNRAELAGGAIANNSGSISIEDSRFYYNRLDDNDNGDYNGGGAIYNNSGDVTIIDSDFDRNRAYWSGGAIANNSGTITIEDSEFYNNQALYNNGYQRGGGAIFNKTGVVTISDKTEFYSNNAEDAGGAIFNLSGTLTIDEARFYYNQTDDSSNGPGLGGGGAIYNFDGNVTISRSAFEDNYSNGAGGAITSYDGTLTIDRSTIAYNDADDGGGLALGRFVTATISNATIAYNDANYYGGGISARGDNVTISSSTIAENYAKYGGGIHAARSVTIESTIVGDNRANYDGDDIYGDVYATHSLIEDTDDVNIIGDDTNILYYSPYLDALADNGGIGRTMLPRKFSDAINAGSNSTNLTTDQLGNPRTLNGQTDIGAVEIEQDPVTFVVDEATDYFDGDYSPGHLSIREAVALSNRSHGADTIKFAPAVQDITLYDGQLNITDSVTITGGPLSAYYRVELDGRDNTRIFNISGNYYFNVDVTLQTLELYNGYTSNHGGAVRVVDAELTMRNCEVTGSSANGSGGGLYARNSNVTIVDTTFYNNNANNSGGGVDFYSGNYNTLTIAQSTFSNNSASNLGGGVRVHGDYEGYLYVDRTTFYNNSADNGGGLAASRLYYVTIRSSTFYRNDANNDGGAVLTYLNDDVRLISSTISDNDANGDGGGILLANNNNYIIGSTIVDNSADDDGDNDGRGGGVADFGGSMRMYSSIVANNSAYYGNDFYGSLYSRRSLIEDTGFTVFNSSYYDITGVDPDLASLQDNGGFTRTHAPYSGSPVINAGGTYNQDTDQRGFARRQGLRADIGSFETVAGAQNFVVSNSSDVFDGDFSPGELTLREAVSLAEVNPGKDSITFSKDITSINLELGELDIDYDVNIIGPGSDKLTISVASTVENKFRIFDLEDADVRISGLKLQGGETLYQGGAIRSERGDLTLDDVVIANCTAGTTFHNGGGAIYFYDGDLTITNSTFDGNSGRFGGAIYFYGSDLVIENSTFTNNMAAGDGGAIYLYNSDLYIVNSTFDHNTAGNNGGAVFANDSGFYALGSTFSFNIAGRSGGAVFADSNDGFYARNSTFAYNEANLNGGAIAILDADDIGIENSTIAGNKADADGVGGGAGGGIFTLPSADIEASIVANNTGATGPDIFGEIDLYYSILENTAGADIDDGSNNLYVDPKLDVLADNGGPTKTMALLPGSPAIDAASDQINGLTTDQRGAGFVRISGLYADIGAFEKQTPPAPLIVTNLNASGPGSLYYMVERTNDTPAQDETITFQTGLTGTIYLNDELYIDDSVAIVGPGKDVITVSGDYSDRIFNLYSSRNKRVVISGLTLQDGYSGNGGGFYISNSDVTIENCRFVNCDANDDGGAISITYGGNLVLRNCEVTACDSNFGDAGAVFSRGNSTVLIENCHFRSNEAYYSGGAVFVSNSSNVTIRRSTFENNEARDGSGGAIFVGSGTLKLESSALIFNEADAGGAVYVSGGTANVTNCTISRNETYYDGGGVSVNGGTVYINNSTIVDNEVGGFTGSGGGVRQTGGTLFLTSTIVANNELYLGYSDVDGTVYANHSLIEYNNGTVNGENNIFNADPNLRPLSNNGGPTRTHTTYYGSVAINSGSNPLGLQFDQRGVGRTFEYATDIGAVETFGYTQNFLVDSAPDVDDGDFSEGNLSLREAVNLSNGNPGADRIAFAPSISSITLNGNELQVNESLYVQGPGADKLTISGDDKSRIFNLYDFGNYTRFFVENVTLINGYSGGSGGAIYSYGDYVHIDKCVFSNNVADYNGGALFMGNARGRIYDSTFSGNTAANNGGGAWINAYPLSFAATSITVSGNSADYGGGVYLSGPYALLRNSTFAGNTATVEGGGISSNALINVTSCIIADNVAPVGPDVDGVIDLDFSLLENTSGATLYVGSTDYLTTVDPRLGPLQDNGGPTPTRLLLSGSPAIDAGSNASPYRQFDQRGSGFVRVSGTAADMGATETSTPVSFVVTNNLDDLSVGSLRAVAALVNAAPGMDDTITFAPNVTGSIVLNPLYGQISLTQSAIVSGPGAAVLSIDADGYSRIFDLAASGNGFFKISGLTFTNGYSSNNGGAIYGNDDNLIVTDSVFHNNYASSDGGAFDGSGDVTFRDCVFTDNDCDDDGGAIDASRLTLDNCQFTDNYAYDSGGAVRASYILTVANCTFDGNEGRNGGAIQATYNATITDSTFSDNYANNDGGALRLGFKAVVRNSLFAGNQAHYYGGAISFDGGYSQLVENSTFSGNKVLAYYGAFGSAIQATEFYSLTIRNSTIVGNTAPNALYEVGAVGVKGGPSDYFDGEMVVTLQSNVIAGNTGGTDNLDIVRYEDEDASPVTINADTNFVSNVKSGVFNGSETGTIIGTDPKLAPLADNGGPTLTHALLPDSPLFDAGINPGNLATDQRGTGFLRVDGLAADLGAFEAQTVSDILLSNNTILEDSAAGSLVGTLSALDADLGDTHVFSLVSGPGGDDNASFALNGADLVTTAVFDFEIKSTYSIRVRAVDGTNRGFEKVFSINVVDRIELASISFLPEQPLVGETVVFTVGVQPQVQGLTITYDYGDGTVDSLGSHAFTAPGTYFVKITITDGVTTIVQIVQVVVAAPAEPIDPIDSDGDGFSNEIEAAAGTDPFNAADTPLGVPITDTKPLTVSKLSAKLNFKATGKDALSFRGTVNVPTQPDLKGKMFIVDFGGVIKVFNVSQKDGRSSKSKTASLKIAKPKGNQLVFDVKVTASDLRAALLKSANLNDVDAKNVTRTIPITVIFSQTAYTVNLQVTYSAKKGTFGRATKK